MTKHFTVDPAVWALFPEATYYVLTIAGVDNHLTSNDEKEDRQRLAKASQAAQGLLTNPTFSQNDVVAQWRQAYQQFKTKKGARSSIEALLKRASQNKTFNPINPAVDLYNAISLTYAVPCGGEDINQLVGDLHLGLAKGGEAFKPLGADHDEPALPGEVFYYDQVGAVCRCFNWREAQRTMLTETTEEMTFIIEALNEEQDQRSKVAAQALASSLNERFNQPVTVQMVSYNRPSVELAVKTD